MDSSRRLARCGKWLLQVLAAAVLVSVPLAAASSTTARQGSEGAWEGRGLPAKPSEPWITSFVAPVSHPLEIVTGPDGALWYTNSGNDSIGRISTRGDVRSFRHSSIANPRGLVAGPDAALWFTNHDGNSIGRLSMHGAFTSFRHASIRGPVDIAAGRDGALWFTNAGDDSIGRITTSGEVTRFRHPSIAKPWGIVAGPDRALWFTNRGNTIGRITTTGAVSDFRHASIRGPRTIVVGPDGALWFTNDWGHSIGRISTGGMVTAFWHPNIRTPHGLTVGPDGAIWFTNFRNGSIGRLTPTGAVRSFKYRDATIRAPHSITLGPDGALWFTNAGSDSIGRITTAGTIKNFRPAGIRFPIGIAAGPDDALWFANEGGESIGRITTRGRIRDFEHRSIRGPWGITAGPDGALWFANWDSDGRRSHGDRGGEGKSIGRISTRGIVTNFRHAGIRGPFWLAPGPDGAVWFTNYRGNSIGRITSDGKVTRFRNAVIRGPHEIAAGPDGALWFANRGSIGRISIDGKLTSFRHASIRHPWGITAGPDGALWFTDYRRHSIGRISTGGAVRSFRHPTIRGPRGIVAGPDGALWFTNNRGNSVGRITIDGVVSSFRHWSIDRPWGITRGPDEAIWFTNDGNNTITRVDPARGPDPITPTFAGVALAAVAGGAGRAGATAPPSPRTLLALAVPISQFAQDGGHLAWMTGRCKDYERPVDHVALRTVSAGRPHVLAPRVCGWDPVTASGERSGDTGLALSGTTAVFWWPVEGGNSTYHRLATGSLRVENLRVFDGYVIATMGGEYVTVAGGEGGALVHAIAGAEVTNGCVGEPIPCEYRSGGRFFRAAAGRLLRVPRVPVPAALDASGTRVAVAPAARRWSRQQRVLVAQLSNVPAARDGGVQIRDLRTGALRATLAPRGRVLDLALAGDAAAALVDRGSGLRIERYAATSGRLLAATRVADNAQDIDVAAGAAIYRVGNEIRAFVAGRTTLLAEASASPIGLSIVGRRVAWAENVGGRGRIRSVTLRK